MLYDLMSGRRSHVVTDEVSTTQLYHTYIHKLNRDNLVDLEYLNKQEANGNGKSHSHIRLK